MAEIIRGNSKASSSKATISTSVAASSSTGGEAIGKVTETLGKGIAASKAGTTMQNIGSSIVNQGLSDLSQVTTAIQSSIYSDKFNQANLEYAALVQKRTDQKFDDKGRPGFLSLTEDLGKIGQQTLEKYLQDIDDPVVREKLTSNFTSQVNNQQIGSLGTARNQQLDYSAATYNEFKRITLEQAKVDSPQNIPLHLGRLQEVLGDKMAAGELSVQQAQKEYQDAARSVGVFQASKYIENDPYKALENLQEDNNPLGLNQEDLQAARQQALIGIQRNEAAKLAQEKAIKQQNEFLVKQIEDIQLSGGAVPIEMQEFLKEQYKGTPMEAQIKGLIEQGQVLEHFSSLSVADQTAFLQEINSTVITDPNLAGLSEKVRTIYTNVQKAIKEDPVAYAARQGLVKQTDPLDFNNLAESLKNKQEAYAAASQHLGVEGTGLTKQEQDQVVTQYNTSSPEQQLVLAQTLKSVYGDRANLLFSEIYKQPTAKDMVYDIYQTQQGKESLVKDRLLGKQIWKEGNVISVPRKDIGQEIRKQMPASVNENLDNAQLDAMVDMYAVVAQRTGNGLDTLSSSTIEGLVKSVINPVERNGISVQTNDSTVAEEQFNASFDNINDDLINQMGGLASSQILEGQTAADVIKEGQLIYHSPGKYMVTLPESNGGSIALDSNNQALILDYKKIEQAFNAKPSRASEPLPNKVRSFLKGLSSTFGED